MQPSDPLRWVDDHGDILYRYALARLRSPERAEDAVQETFVAALHARDSYSGRATERTWLVGILRHKIADQVRRQWREPPLSEVGSGESRSDDEATSFDRRGMWSQDRPQAWSNPSQALEEQEFWDVFARCLDHLPERLADVFALRELDELSSPELCQVLGISPTNLWAMLSRARVRLRQCLEKHWFEKG